MRTELRFKNGQRYSAKYFVASYFSCFTNIPFCKITLTVPNSRRFDAETGRFGRCGTVIFVLHRGNTTEKIRLEAGLSLYQPAGELT